MKHPYEYEAMLNFYPFQVHALATEEEERIGLFSSLVEYAQQLPARVEVLAKSKGGGWEVNSHSIALVGDTLLVSTLLQRQRT